MAIRRRVLYSSTAYKLYTRDEIVDLKNEYKRMTREGNEAKKIFNAIHYLAAQISSAAAKLVNLLTGAELSGLFSSKVSAENLFYFYDDVVDEMYANEYTRVRIKYYEERVELYDGKDDHVYYEGFLPADKLPEVTRYDK